MAQIDYLVKPFGEDCLVLHRYFECVKALKFEEEPNYDFLRKMFREILIKRSEENQPFDWEKVNHPRRKKN